MISVVCPFYNEEKILETCVISMIRSLDSLADDWELIVVNDGSTDQSLEIARALEPQHPQLRVISYSSNRGRGYAIRTGVQAAKGDIAVTTEIDLSWGDDIVHRIVAEFRQHPDADIVVASPHLPGGGYKNVPKSRMFLSTYGNRLIRMGMSFAATMNTGMTRGYRREKFLALPLDENGKEMHLEIINKAVAFGYEIYEIPALLEWKDFSAGKDPGKKRKSSSNVNRLIRTHLLFAIGAAPFRYIYSVSGTLGFLSIISFGVAVFKLFTPAPSIYWLLTSFFLALFGFLFLAVGLLSQQNRAITRELWLIRGIFKNFFEQTKE
jgi:glycosyltransferase involved in cell wall biosynthesis